MKGQKNWKIRTKGYCDNLIFPRLLETGIIPALPWHFSQESTMERELLDRADDIQKRILQLRDSL